MNRPHRMGTFRLRAVIIPFLIVTLIWGSTWIVIRDQLRDVPTEWSVAYRFGIASVAMALFATLKKRGLKLDREGMIAALILGIALFCVTFNAIYLAEIHLVSGVVATFFAIMIIPTGLFGWAMLGQRPRRQFAIGSGVAIAGIVLLSLNELQTSGARPSEVFGGVLFAVLGLLGASWTNLFQAFERIVEHHLKPLLAWAMGFGALANAALAWAISGPPVFSPRPGYWAGLAYLGIVASAFAFNLYFPVVRKLGPGRATSLTLLAAIIALGLSTWLEDFRWSGLAIGGSVLTLAGALIALRRTQTGIIVTTRQGGVRQATDQ